jgi:dTDP-4-amino-4,6-dideoxygalactose transaminase
LIPISRLSIGEAEAAAASEVIRSGWIAQGKRTEEFESLVAAYVGAKHAVAVSSATTGLHLALVAAGVRPGDDVICPSYSFIATANAIVHAGARPRFVDIDRRTYNIDPASIEAALTPRTTAILPVSQVGLPADLEGILAIARRHGIRVVEDAAPSFGARLMNRHLGSISDFTVFSFDARKILTTGEGGVITTHDDAAAARMRAMRAHSASASMLERHTMSNVVLERYPELGYNYKMTDIAAAIGVVQMARVEELIAERRRIARRYGELLRTEHRVALPYEPAGYRHVYQSYTVRLLTGHSQSFVMSEMASKKVATRRVIACHLEGDYRRSEPTLSLPESEAASARTLLLPMFAGLTDREQDIVVDALRSALDQPEDPDHEFSTETAEAGVG